MSVELSSAQLRRSVRALTYVCVCESVGQRVLLEHRSDNDAGYWQASAVSQEGRAASNYLVFGQGRCLAILCQRHQNIVDGNYLFHFFRRNPPSSCKFLRSVVCL